MEIGSFIEAQYPCTGEYYKQVKNVARLNSGRAAIWHSLRVLNASAVWLPYYQCDSVKYFLERKNVRIKYYNIDSDFNPIGVRLENDEAILFANYFGIMSYKRLLDLSKRYKKVVIDNSQSFFTRPIKNVMNVYSCRKFMGVPDGAYVIGKNADAFVDEYIQGKSSDSSLFLLQRIEYGCEGKVYEARQKNEERLNIEDISKMSLLTRKILSGTDYNFIRKKRVANFKYASKLFDSINMLNTKKYFDRSCVPMVYPLVVENDKLLDYMLENKHFQGHWWSYLLEVVKQNSFEYWLSKYVIPITIDQRYGRKEIFYLYKTIKEFI